MKEAIPSATCKEDTALPPLHPNSIQLRPEGAARAVERVIPQDLITGPPPVDLQVHFQEAILPDLLQAVDHLPGLLPLRTPQEDEDKTEIIWFFSE